MWHCMRGTSKRTNLYANSTVLYCALLYRVVSGTVPLRGLSAIATHVVQLVQIILTQQRTRPHGGSTYTPQLGSADPGTTGRAGHRGRGHLLRDVGRGSSALAVTATKEVLHVTYQIVQVLSVSLDHWSRDRYIDASYLMTPIIYFL